MTDTAAADLEVTDQAPAREEFLRDVQRGLQASPKTLPCKYFYDERGSQLFDEICELPEYYPTRTELGIMGRDGDEMAAALGPACLVVEYGSGSSMKTRLLLDRLEEAAGYVPVDISREHLLASAAALAAEYPSLEVLPVCADFAQPFELPAPSRSPKRTAVYFPGSTIGNFTADQAEALLGQVRDLVGPGGSMLVGVDLVKEASVLERAYDDAAGVTAAFNLNLLERMNRELGADFAVERFRHRAVWCPEPSRIEMHLVSETDQSVRLGDATISFAAGESICTEHSHKYSRESFAAISDRAGLDVERVWTDDAELFSVQALRAR